MTGDYTHASAEAMEHAMELVADSEGGKVFNLDRTSTKPKTAADSASAAAS
jgi:hypothetical protein